MIASLQEKKPQVPPQRFALSQNKLQLLDFKWVAQVSLLRPGFLLANGSSPEHPGLKIETWATHLIFVRVIFSLIDGPVALSNPSGEATPDEPMNHPPPNQVLIQQPDSLVAACSTRSPNEINAAGSIHPLIGTALLLAGPILSVSTHPMLPAIGG
jgi:hypothetical protein